MTTMTMMPTTVVMTMVMLMITKVMMRNCWQLVPAPPPFCMKHSWCHCEPRLSKEDCDDDDDDDNGNDDKKNISRRHGRTISTLLANNAKLICKQHRLFQFVEDEKRLREKYFGGVETFGAFGTMCGASPHPSPPQPARSRYDLAKSTKRHQVSFTASQPSYLHTVHHTFSPHCTTTCTACWT